MDTNKVLNEVLSRQLAGVKFHHDMAIYFNYLNMEEMKELHRYQEYKELVALSDEEDYYISHCKVLPREYATGDKMSQVEEWYREERSRFSKEEREFYLNDALYKWESFEKCNRIFFEACAKELIEGSELVVSDTVMSLAKECEQELILIDKIVGKINGNS